MDKHSKVHDTKMSHIDWNTFHVLCNKSRERLEMISLLILSGLVNVASHLVSVQSSKMIMALAHHYVPEEFIRSVIREMVLDMCLDNIEKVFHLPPTDQF